MALLLALAIVLGTGGQDPRPQPRDPVKKPVSAPVTGAISGRVTDAETGRPVADAVVRGTVPSGAVGQFFEALTDPDGRYEHLRVLPGDYLVVALPHRHRGEHRTAGFGITEASAAALAAAPRVAIAAGETRTGVDIRLPRGRAIEGRISNEAGEPLADVIVRAARVDAEGAMIEARTDDRGLYRVHGLAPGSYRLCAETRSAALDPGAAAAQSPPYPRSCYSAGAASTLPDAVVVGSADAMAADIVMTPGEPGGPPRQGPGGATLRGRITDASTGLPLQGAIVLVRSFNGDGSFTTAVADSEGYYAVGGLGAGVWTVRAAPGHHRTSHVPRGFAVSGHVRGASGIRIAEGEERSDINIALLRAGAIAGRIVDDSGQPVSGIRLQLYHAPGGRAVVGAASHITDDRGLFRLFGIEPGRYFLCTQPPVVISSRAADAGLRRRVPAAACHPSDTTGEFGQAITVVSGDTGGLEIRMPWHQNRQMSGTVLTSEGSPASGALVSARPVSGRARFEIVAPPARGDGRFIFSELAPGRYTLTARSTGSDPGAEWVTVEVDLTGEDAKDIIAPLHPPVITPGRITYDGQEPTENRLPVIVVESAAPGVFPSHSSKPEITHDLRFEIRGRLGPQLVSVESLPTGWVVERIRYRGTDITGRATTFVPGAGEVEITLTSKPARVTGRILDGGGNPVPSAVVLVLPADRARLPTRRAWTMTTANTEGRFETPAVPAGDYLLLALTQRDLDDVADDPPAYLLERFAERITLSPNERRALDLRLRLADDERFEP
jgi:protocatechuate 3,4-dioxygenase beta subunit